jgi:hypothetical protein
MGYTRSVETLREQKLEDRFFRLQIGDNWCWAAITSALLNQALSGLSSARTKNRQCDIVQMTLDAGRKACHRQERADAQQIQLEHSPCDPRLCRITRDIDVEGNLAEQFASRGLMADVFAHNGQSGIVATPLTHKSKLPPDMLSDQLEIDDVIRLIDARRYIVLRFVGSGRPAHFIVIYGYSVAQTIKAVHFFDPANGSSAGLRLRNGHGVRPLREVKARYGTMATTILVVTTELPDL